MAPSPRKSAPLAQFNQTWDQTDTAFLDPHTLPVAKLPRAWERKQETRRIGNGKEKKVWRRYTLRSREQNITDDMDEDEEEHDVRSRAIKRQQRMSPEAMEKTVTLPHIKKRAFKGTRWDRRKSVLPRKKTNRHESLQENSENDSDLANDMQDTPNLGGNNVSFSEVDTANTQDNTSLSLELSESEDQRSNFTFEVEQSVDEDVQTGVSSPVDQDATLMYLFRSPTKGMPAPIPSQPMDLEYPELPQEESEPEVEALPDTLIKDKSEAFIEPIVDNDIESRTVEDEGIEDDNLSEQKELVSPVLEVVDQAHPEQDVQVSLVETSEPLYPELPVSSPSADAPLSPAQLEMKSSVESEMADITDTVTEFRGNGDQDIASEAFMDITQEEATREEKIQEAYTAECTFQETEQTVDFERIFQDEETPDEEPVKPLDQVMEVSECEATPALAQHNMLEDQSIDITDGLTLGPSKPSSTDHIPRKLRSPSPPPMQCGPDDATMTLALDDDTALLKDFLNRAAASKAEKAATISRRESLQNRRDSDVVRYALASPRKALEAKDPNSPSKCDNDATLDLSQTLTLNTEETTLSLTQEQGSEGGDTESKNSTTSRRSSRTRKSRLPAPPSGQQAQASKIAVRRADGSEHIVLKKSDAQELSQLTRNNTRKNKQGAFPVNVRLLKLAMDAASLPSIDNDAEIVKEAIAGKRNVRWDEQLAYYQENTESMASIAAEAESLATPDELSLPSVASNPSAKPKSRSSKDKNSTPKIRRVRGLGTANGTPGKGLLAPAYLLPEAVQEEKEATPSLPKKKSSKVKKMPIASEIGSISTPMSPKLPSLEVAPVGIDTAQTKGTKERKSRLATPKRVKLPQPVTSSAPIGDGKENQSQTRAAIGGATPKKGIPVPSGIVLPSVGVESGLPRRRGRKA